MKKQIRILLTAMILLLCAAFPARAQTRAISTVRFTCRNSLKAGDVLNLCTVDLTGGGTGDVNLYPSDNFVITACDLSQASSTAGRTVSVGDTVRVKLTLEPAHPEDYKFQGTYTSSNVKITGGTLVQATVKNGDLVVIFNIGPVSGTLDMPEQAYWKGTGSSGPSAGPGASSGTDSVSVKNIGKAVWSGPTGQKVNYEVMLYCGEKLMHRFTEVTQKTLDCYPYMTRRGSYYFKVRSIPATEQQRKYAQPSDWMISDEFYVDETHVSDGTGQEAGSGSSAQVGWIKSGTTWYYRYPSGELKKNGWEKVDGKWYLFDREGKMLTGMQTISSGTFMLAASGEMLTGWQKSGNQWYFFKDTPGAADEGVMLKNAWRQDPDGKTYYLGENGVMVTGWKKIGEYWYHFDASGNLSRNTVVDTFKINADGVWVTE